MPELPDLQVFSHNLTKKLKGKKLLKIDVKVAQKLNVPVKELGETLEKQTLKRVSRAGKQLHIEFEHGPTLGIHLMLHGQLHFFDQTNENKFTIVEFHFDDGKGLALTDFQKAATLTLNPEETKVPDAMEADVDYLEKKLGATRTAVKTVLMDQKIIRGIGNAYADEILYHAKISPFSAANKLPANAVKQLIKSIKHVLENAEKQILKARPDAISGEYRDFLEVHQPRLKKTLSGVAIHQKPVGSRKTYYTDEQELFS